MFTYRLFILCLLLNFVHISSLESDPNCSTGIRRKVACCLESCGRCGGLNCELRDGGEEGCCIPNIVASHNSCNNNLPPCILEDTEHPTTTPTYSPTVSPTSAPIPTPVTSPTTTALDKSIEEGNNNNNSPQLDTPETPPNDEIPNLDNSPVDDNDPMSPGENDSKTEDGTGTDITSENTTILILSGVIFCFFIIIVILSCQLIKAKCKKSGYENVSKYGNDTNEDSIDNTEKVQLTKV